MRQFARLTYHLFKPMKSGPSLNASSADDVPYPDAESLYANCTKRRAVSDDLRDDEKTGRTHAGFLENWSLPAACASVVRPGGTSWRGASGCHGGLRERLRSCERDVPVVVEEDEWSHGVCVESAEASFG